MAKWWKKGISLLLAGALMLGGASVPVSVLAEEPVVEEEGEAVVLRINGYGFPVEDLDSDVQLTDNGRQEENGLLRGERLAGAESLPESYFNLNQTIWISKCASGILRIF